MIGSCFWLGLSLVLVAVTIGLREMDRLPDLDFLAMINANVALRMGSFLLLYASTMKAGAALARLAQ